MPSSDCFVSVVAPLYNDAAILDSFVDQVHRILADNYANFELLLIDDGSKDATSSQVGPLLQKHHCIRYIQLSRRFGKEVAISAGLDSAIGDYVVVIVPYMDPPGLIPEIVHKARMGSNIVYGVLDSRRGQPFWLRLGARSFFWCANRLFNLDIPRDATHFRVLSRKAVNALNRITDTQRYLRVMSIQVGYENESFRYQPTSSAGSRSQTFFEAMTLGINILRSNSINPLRLVTWIGLLASFVNVGYMVYLLARNPLLGGVSFGQTVFGLQISALFFLVFLILVVLSEYLGAILLESKGGPRYHVSDDRNSAVMIADQERRNVVTSAEHAVSDHVGT